MFYFPSILYFLNRDMVNLLYTWSQKVFGFRDEVVEYYDKFENDDDLFPFMFVR